MQRCRDEAWIQGEAANWERMQAACPVGRRATSACSPIRKGHQMPWIHVARGRWCWTTSVAAPSNSPPLESRQRFVVAVLHDYEEGAVMLWTTCRTVTDLPLA